MVVFLRLLAPCTGILSSTSPLVWNNGPCFQVWFKCHASVLEFFMSWSRVGRLETVGFEVFAFSPLHSWERSSIGRARASHARGTGIETRRFHWIFFSFCSKKQIQHINKRLCYPFWSGWTSILALHTVFFSHQGSIFVFASLSIFTKRWQEIHESMILIPMNISPVQNLV